MIVPGNASIILALTLSILVSSAYAAGRIHQWRKDGLQRDEAYRDGHDKASRSMMHMMQVLPDQQRAPVHRVETLRPSPRPSPRPSSAGGVVVRH